MPFVWIATGILIGLTASLFWDLTRFRGESRAIIEAERKDQARYAIQVLMVKSTVASRVAEIVLKYAPHDHDAIAASAKLYEEVATSWLPKDVDPSLVKLKERALEASRLGRPVVLH